MLTTVIFTMLYLFVASIAVTLTYVEQRNTGHRSMIFTALGFMACAVWPLTLLIVALAVTVRPTQPIAS